MRGCVSGPLSVDELLADAMRVVPLVLLLVQLLQVEQRVLVLRVEPQHFLNASSARSTKPPCLKSRPRHSSDVGVLDLRQLRPLQQRLVHLDGARHLAALAVDVAENQVDLERVGVDARRLAQLLDREVDLVGDQEVEAEHVVVRLARAAAVDPAAVAQLVALPGLADGEAGEQREQRGDEAEGTPSSTGGR